MSGITVVSPHCISLRIPQILAARVKKLVEEKRGEFPKFSMNDWIVEAMREKADGGVVVEEVIPRSVDNFLVVSGRKSVEELRAGVGKVTGGEVDSGSIRNRAWLPEIVRIKKNEDEGSRREAMEELIPPEFELPKGFWLWETAKQAKYLDQYCPLEER